MCRTELTDLLTAAIERSVERLRAEGHESPWPEDFRARDIVRLLVERSREVALKVYGQDEGES